MTPEEILFELVKELKVGHLFCNTFVQLRNGQIKIADQYFLYVKGGHQRHMIGDDIEFGNEIEAVRNGMYFVSREYAKSNDSLKSVEKIFFRRHWDPNSKSEIVTIE